MEPVGVIESISPMDRLAVRLAEWARLGSQNLVESQSVPYANWVSQRRVTEPDESDSRDPPSEKGKREGRIYLSDSYIQFTVDRATKDVSVRIIDRATGKLIRTIPPDEFFRIMHDLDISKGTLLETLL